MVFDPNFAEQFLSPSDPYPIELEKICDWLGLPGKHTALDIVQDYFEEGEDYTISGNDVCWLTVDCLKELAVIVNTQEGKVARRYYLERDHLQQKPVPEEPAPIIMPTATQLYAMRTRESEKLELATLPVSSKKIPRFRRAVDIARDRAAKATEEEDIGW